MLDCFISTATQGSSTTKEIKEGKKSEYPHQQWKQDVTAHLSMNMTAWKPVKSSARYV